MTTSTVWKATNSSYGDTCHFGDHAAAVAWARGGTVVPVEVQHYTPPALHVPKTDLLAEAVRMIQGYQRAGWLTNPAAGEQASDFIARASHEPPQPAEATECRYCDEVMKERDDYHEWADTLAYDIERLVGVEIGEHSNLNSPWGNAHDAAEYELDKRARKPHEPGETCAWAYVDDGSWLTNCGESAILENGGTAYSDMRFCCFCGKPTP